MMFCVFTKDNFEPLHIGVAPDDLLGGQLRSFIRNASWDTLEQARKRGFRFENISVSEAKALERWRAMGLPEGEFPIERLKEREDVELSGDLNPAS
jgi:hypothetical protein